MPRDLFAESSAPAAAQPRDLFAAPPAPASPVAPPRDLFATASAPPLAVPQVAPTAPPALLQIPTPAELAKMPADQLAAMAHQPMAGPTFGQELQEIAPTLGQRVAGIGRDVMNVGRAFVANQTRTLDAQGEQIIQSRGMDPAQAAIANQGFAVQSAMAGVGGGGLDMPALPMSEPEKAEALKESQASRDAAAQQQADATNAIQNPVVKHVGGAAVSIAPFMVASAAGGPVAAAALAGTQAQGETYDANERALRQHGGVSTPEDRSNAAGGAFLAGTGAALASALPGGRGVGEKLIRGGLTGGAFDLSNQIGQKVATGREIDTGEVRDAMGAGVVMDAAMQAGHAAFQGVRGTVAAQPRVSAERPPVDLFARTAADRSPVPAPEPREIPPPPLPTVADHEPVPPPLERQPVEVSTDNPDRAPVPPPDAATPAEQGEPPVTTQTQLEQLARTDPAAARKVLVEEHGVDPQVADAYVTKLTPPPVETSAPPTTENPQSPGRADRYAEAVQAMQEAGRDPQTSGTSAIQTKLGIGYDEARSYLLRMRTETTPPAVDDVEPPLVSPEERDALLAAEDPLGFPGTPDEVSSDIQSTQPQAAPVPVTTGEADAPAISKPPAIPPGNETAEPAAVPLPRATTPAEFNAKTWFHGSATPGLTAKTLDATATKADSLFGHGVYLTDAPDIGQGYAKARAGRRGEPTLYQAKTNVQNVLDLEQPAPPAVTKAILDAADHWPDSGAREAVEEAAAKPGATAEKQWRALSNAFSEHSHADEIPDYEFSDAMHSLADDLRKQGYDAITHTGGKRTGKPPHQVLIVLDPSDVGQVGRSGTITDFRRADEPPTEEAKPVTAQPAAPAPAPAVPEPAVVPALDRSGPGWQKKRRQAQERIEAGKTVTRSMLEPFAGEKWADDALAAKAPARAKSTDGITAKRQQLVDQLRDLVIQEHGRDAADLSSSHPLALAVERGEATPGKLISPEKAIDLAAKLPEDHPAQVVLHNIAELAKNPRGTKFVSEHTDQIPDGGRVVVNDGETLTVNHSNGTIEDGVTTSIPEGGVTLVGKKILPPAEFSPEEVHGAFVESGATPEIAAGHVEKLGTLAGEENRHAAAQGTQDANDSGERAPDGDGGSARRPGEEGGAPPREEKPAVEAPAAAGSELSPSGLRNSFTPTARQAKRWAKEEADYKAAIDRARPIRDRLLSEGVPLDQANRRALAEANAAQSKEAAPRTKWDSSIERLRAKVAKLEPVFSKPNEIPGPLATGRDNYRMGRQLDAENNRKAEAFRQWTKAKEQLADWESRRESFLAGEVHKNGQPRADAPSRVAGDRATAALSDYLRDTIKSGDTVYVPGGNAIGVKRVNAKSITSDSGTTWKYDEITPAHPEGRPMKPREVVDAFKSWKDGRAEPDAPATPPAESKPAVPAFYEGGPSQAQAGIFGQPEILNSGVGEQKPLFHQPVDVPAPTSERVGSKAANDPKNTGEMFPPKATETGKPKTTITMPDGTTREIVKDFVPKTPAFKDVTPEGYGPRALAPDEVDTQLRHGDVQTHSDVMALKRSIADGETILRGRKMPADEREMYERSVALAKQKLAALYEKLGAKPDLPGAEQIEQDRPGDVRAGTAVDRSARARQSGAHDQDQVSSGGREEVPGEAVQQPEPRSGAGQDADQNDRPQSGAVTPPGGEIRAFGGGAVTKAREIGEAVLGRSPFVREDAAPTAIEAARNLVEAKTDIQRLFAPQTRGQQARQQGNLIREHAAELAQRTDRAQAALAGARQFFEGRTPADNLDFIDKVETGAQHGDPKLDAIAKQLRDLLDGRRKEVQSLGTGKLQHFIADYFPHIWKDEKKAEAVFAQILGKRPLEGSKSFLKQRSIPTTKDGIAAGLEPISNNPVDLALLKVHEMDRYMMGQRILKEMRGNGLAKYVSVNDKAPEGYAPIEDKIATVYGPPTVKVKEFVDRAVNDALDEVADNLGIKHERVINAPGDARRRGLGNLPAGAIGYSEQGGDRIVSQFATDLSVKAHEIGHQIDAKYDTDRIVGKYVRELDALTELRFTNVDPARVTEKEREYNLDPAEQMAQVVEAYVHAPQRMKEVAPHVFDAFDQFVDAHPELEPLKTAPSLSLKQLTNEKEHGGLLTMGRYYAPEPAARVLNNYLSPGLRQKSGAFRTYLGLANVMNQAQLGFSAFHLGFTSMDAAVSKVALGIEKISDGKMLRGAGDIARAPLAPVENIARGAKVRQEWLNPGSTDAETAKIVDFAKAAGARVDTDSFYRTSVAKRMREAFKQGNYAGGVLRAPFALVEQLSRPIMEYVVPRQKLGIFADLARHEMEKLPPGASRDQVRAAAASAWDSVDNRMGQIVYDNLFWNKAAKDIGMASVRSLGWNLGTWRELGGAVTDTIGQGARLARGERPRLTHRQAYAIALPAVTAAVGGLMHYLMTGKRPDELKDYFFPKTGETDEQGHAVRLSLPSYMKDVVAMREQPGQTMLHKLHPALNTIAEMLQNADYYNTKIRNEDDPIIKQATDEVKFLGKQFTPFSVRGFQQMSDAGASPTKKILPFIGITQAPRSISATPAERLADEIAREEVPQGARTQEEADKSRAKADLVKQMRREPAKARELLVQAVRSRTIRADEAQPLREQAAVSPLMHRVKKMDAPSSLRVYAVANEEERKAMRQLVMSKIVNSKTLTPDEKRQSVERLRRDVATQSGVGR